MPDPKRLASRSVHAAVSRGMTVFQASQLVIQIVQGIAEEMPAEYEAGIAWLTAIERAAASIGTTSPDPPARAAVPASSGSVPNAETR